MSDVTVERLEALLRGDAPRTPAEQRRSALVGELRAGVLSAPPALRARVLAGEPEPSRRRRFVLVLVPAAAAIAVLAAVVHGIASSGPRPSPPVVAAPAPVPLQKLAPATHAAASGSAVAVPSTSSGARLQHTDASLELRVADADRVSAATTKATRIASGLGGYAQSVHFTSNPAEAELDLRVPAQTVRTAIARLEALGTVVSQSLSQEDLQHLFATENDRIAQLRRRVAVLAKAVADPSLPDAQRILLRLRLDEARRSLAQALAQRQGTVAAAADARISLLLTTSPKAAVVPPHRGRLGRMIHSAAGFLALEGTIVLYALVVLSPLLVLGAAAWWLARLRRRREERRLLAA